MALSGGARLIREGICGLCAEGVRYEVLHIPSPVSQDSLQTTYTNGLPIVPVLVQRSEWRHAYSGCHVNQGLLDGKART